MSDPVEQGVAAIASLNLPGAAQVPGVAQVQKLNNATDLDLLPAVTSDPSKDSVAGTLPPNASKWQKFVAHPATRRAGKALRT